MELTPKTGGNLGSIWDRLGIMWLWIALLVALLVVLGHARSYWYCPVSSPEAYASFFRDKVVWITGASSGIGEALTVELARAGALVVLSARRKDALERVRDACDGSHHRPVVLPLDLAELEAMEDKVAECRQAIGAGRHVDAIIHNGGISTRALASATGLDVDRHIMNVNYFGAVALTKALLPSLIQSGKRSDIAVTSSVQGILPVPCRAAYAASKHALHGFFDSLRAELQAADYPIGVELICPGYVRTNISVQALSADGSKHGQLDASQQRGYDPVYVARATMTAIMNRAELCVVAQPVARVGVLLKLLLPWVSNAVMSRRSRAEVRAFLQET